MKNSTLKQYVNEISKRGGETTIEHMPYGRSGWKHAETIDLNELDRGKSEGKTVYLIGCDGWRYYSRKFGSRHASLRYLVGTDDSGRWAVRVPGTCETVNDAVEWITPSAVKKARAQKRRVLRQGNLYLVESPRAREHVDSVEESGYWYGSDYYGPLNFGDHEYYHNSRVLLHPEHAPKRVPAGRWQAVEQKNLMTNRGAARD